MLVQILTNFKIDDNAYAFSTARPTRPGRPCGRGNILRCPSFSMQCRDLAMPSRCRPYSIHMRLHSLLIPPLNTLVLTLALLSWHLGADRPRL